MSQAAGLEMGKQDRVNRIGAGEHSKDQCDGRDYVVTIEDDFSYPQYSDRDYGLEANDIEFSNENPQPGETVTIRAAVHNHGVCQAGGAWGWYSSNGRSCWGEWDFDYTGPDFVDISYRCQDKDATVRWRVELDGVHLASVDVPRSATDVSWKVVTIHDVPISAGGHRLFLGTYQMDYYPDYHLDWLRIGDVHIEAEDYTRMGGNDPNPDLRGLGVFPRAANPPASTDLTVQLWNGDPSAGGVLLAEDFVGETNEVIDSGHDYSGNRYTAHYIANNDVGTLEVDWTPPTAGTYDLYVVVDPHEVLNEIDEDNNVTHRTIEVGDQAPDCNDNGIPDECDLDCGEPGGPCDVPGCGQSQDCNGNGIPDECESDVDGDGVIDECDTCPESDLSEMIVIQGCETGVANLMVGGHGCSMADHIAACAEGAATHGGFVSCVAHLTNDWKGDGLITGREKGQIQRCAAKAGGW